MESSYSLTLFDPAGFWGMTPADLLRALASRHAPDLLESIGATGLGKALRETAEAKLYGITGAVLARGIIAALAGLVARLVTRGSGTLALTLGIVMGFLGLVMAGWPLPFLAFTVVGYVTLAAYGGVTGGKRSPFRVLIVLLIRFVALALTFITLAQPALVVRSENKVPSTLLFFIDVSESMTIKDEYNNQTRFEAMQLNLDRCKPMFDQLKEDHQITVKIIGFAGDVHDWSDTERPDGKISDYGFGLNGLYQRYGEGTKLRGVILIGDGAHNGHRQDPLNEARRWRTAITAFGLGQATTPFQQKDIAITSLTVEPSPVFVKGRMIIRAMVDAYGCENSPIQPQLFIEGKEWPLESIKVNGAEPADLEPRLPKTNGNELLIETSAPESPGEIQLTLRIKPLPGEAAMANNQRSTFVTVAKEGVAVLLVAPLDEETKYIRQALRSDPRVRLFETTRQTEEAPRGVEAQLFNFERQAYDVIILRNVSRKRLAPRGYEQVPNQISELVRNKGVGLLMMGGFDSFGGTPEIPGSGDWAGTPIGDLLPVELDVSGHIQGDAKAGVKLGLHPTREGKDHYLMQLATDANATKKKWDQINDAVALPGVNRLGRKKATAEILATARPDDPTTPILVAHTLKGRVMAFAGDTTYLWRIFGLPETTEGVDMHARFWKQTVLWLAQQENTGGSVWIKPDKRNVAVGESLSFAVGIRGKSGFDLKVDWKQEINGKRVNTVRIVAPNGVSSEVPVAQEGQAYRCEFKDANQTGVYRIEAAGQTLDLDGKPVNGTASVRFLVEQDEREILQQAADLDFLGKLAAASGGRSRPYRIDELPDYVASLQAASAPSEQVKTDRYPNWRNTNLTPFLPIWLVIFTTVLLLEWGLRRMWGMV